VWGGFLYLVAIMDWASRRVLARRLSNTMDTEFCLEALTDALERFGGAEMIFNTDSQFTSIAFTSALQDAGSGGGGAGAGSENGCINPYNIYIITLSSIVPMCVSW